MSIVHDHRSGRFDRAVALLRKDLDDSADTGANVITGTEADQRAQGGKRRNEVIRWATEHHFSCTIGSRDSNNDCFILTATSRFLFVAGGTFPVRSVNRPEPPDAAWQVVIDRATGQRLLISVFHAPHAVEVAGRFRPGKKAEQWRTEIRNWHKGVEQLAAKHHADAVIMTGDWNVHLGARNGQIRDWIKAEFPGWAIPIHRPATHGYRAIDFALTRGLNRGGVVALPKSKASDHRGIRMTYAWKKAPVATSQNGWRAYADGRDPDLVAIPQVEGRVRRGGVATIFTHLVDRFDREVEDVDEGRAQPNDDWGWAGRPIRGKATGLSNHASGTAIDLNATQHPIGRRGTFTAKQVKAIHEILDDLDGVIRWGGDYSGRPDEMHFEINADAAAVAVVARRLRTSGKDWFSMATKEELRAVVREELERLTRDEKGAPSIGNARIEDPDGGVTYTLARRLKQIENAIKAVAK